MCVHPFFFWPWVSAPSRGQVQRYINMFPVWLGWQLAIANVSGLKHWPLCKIQVPCSCELCKCTRILIHSYCGHIWPRLMRCIFTSILYLKGKFAQKTNWDMLLYTMSWFKWHRSCQSMTFRSWDAASESFDYIIYYIISVMSLTPTVCTPVQTWSQWRHRNDEIRTFRGHISRTKCRR